MRGRLASLLLCVSVGIVAYVCLDFWSARNGPLYKRLERQWQDDVDNLEASHKLPGPWFDVRDLEMYGGTPESRNWIKRIHIPIKTKKDGHYKMEVLLVAWEEDGKRGALVQYNLVDLKSGNNIWELGRTYILSAPKSGNSLANLWQELRQ
jgi:hypothetical protein